MFNLNNDTIESILWRKENISKIEYLLDREIKKLNNLKKEKLDYGNKMSLEKLQDYFPEVCKEVDEFLKVNGGVPKIDYLKDYKNLYFIGTISATALFYYNIAPMMQERIGFGPISDFIASMAILGSFYFGSFFLYNRTYSANYQGLFFHKDKNIKVKKTKFANLISTLAHEYTHFLQSMKSINTNNNKFLKEGQALGVERQIALKYSEKENNKAFLYNNSVQDVFDFRKTYETLCEKFGKKPSKGLIKRNFLRELFDISPKEIKSRKEYIVGRSFFSICELEHGLDIYSRMFNYDFSFITKNL